MLDIPLLWANVSINLDSYHLESYQRLLSRQLRASGNAQLDVRLSQYEKTPYFGHLSVGRHVAIFIKIVDILQEQAYRITTLRLKTRGDPFAFRAPQVQFPNLRYLEFSCLTPRGTIPGEFMWLPNMKHLQTVQFSKTGSQQLLHKARHSTHISLSDYTLDEVPDQVKGRRGEVEVLAIRCVAHYEAKRNVTVARIPLTLPKLRHLVLDSCWTWAAPGGML
jgi:hypothetical protein